MSLTDIILSTVIISLFCLGLRTCMCEGMIFHFIRKPFEYEPHSKVMNYFRKKLQGMALSGTGDLLSKRRLYLKHSQKLDYILKPFVLCVVCFSSVWGASLFLSINGPYIPELVIACISATFIIKIINDYVEF